MPSSSSSSSSSSAAAAAAAATAAAAAAAAAKPPPAPRIVVDIDRPQIGSGPGPAYYPRGVGGIGPQISSTVATEARVIIGTSKRWVREAGADGPGPGSYELKAPRGPSYSIRNREKFGTEGGSSTALQAPGPGSHKRLETSMTRKQNAPAYSLKPRRVARQGVDDTPAPGHSQKVTSASEKQVLSTKQSLVGIKFGNAGRDAGAEPTDSTGNIGPGEYVPDYTRSSDFHNPPRYSMPGRWRPTRKNAVEPELLPLPGGTGKQVLSSIRTMPSFSLSGRTKFGSMWVAMQCTRTCQCSMSLPAHYPTRSPPLPPFAFLRPLSTLCRY